MELNWCTDAAKAVGKGYGGHHLQSWFFGLWDKEFLRSKDPSIEFLELYAVTAGILLWLKLYQNRRIVLFCDNQSVVYMINSQSSKCKNCMTLLRLITLESLISNVRVYAKHIRAEANRQADALSRNLVPKFLELSQKEGLIVNNFPTEIPQILNDIPSWWID